MRAFLFYIDDWLSSKKIARMDAVEERGYLRLLLYAATEPDCGLPNDDDELANISLLGPQWNKPTADEFKRFKSQTSGQKLRACFIEKGERLFNDRLLREFEHQKDVSAKRSASAKLGVEQKKANASANVERSLEQTGEQNASNDVCVCASTPVVNISSKAIGPPLAEAPARASPGFDAWWSIWSSVRGTNHKRQAAMAWGQVATIDNEQESILCTASYVASLDNPAKGYNPENFLLDQARDGFSARWPPRSRDPAEQRKRRDSDKFHLMMAATTDES